MKRMKTPIKTLPGIFALCVLAACSTGNMNASINREYNRKMDHINIATYDMSSPDGVYDDPNLFFSMLANGTELSQQQRALVEFGRQYLGATYVYGSTNPGEGFDCSGYTQYAYKHVLNINLPRTAAQMSQVGVQVTPNDLKAGDLVFFNTSGANFSHVGIYIGEGKFFHASTKQSAIVIGDMAAPYFSSRYNGARRIIGINDIYNTAGLSNANYTANYNPNYQGI